MGLSIRISTAVLCAGATFAPFGLRAQTAEEVVVVGQTPLGAGLDERRLAANVQTATADDLADQRALDLADFMNRTLTSVFVNEAQSNPLQPDVQYRGFVGSPLLGLPQGIAVYQDGVRMNEPFGDTVNWALIPESAIATVALIPGSNPLFGLNALGGAVAVETKSGFTHPGTEAELYGGSFNRIGATVSSGAASGDRFSRFVTASYLDEEGWREHSPTAALQAFAKLSWRGDSTDVDLGMSVADTDLIGNGPAPVELLAFDRDAVYTRPDRTENDLALVSLNVERTLSDVWTLSGNAYVRASDVATLNGDDSDFDVCAADPGYLCAFENDAEAFVLDSDGLPIPFDDTLVGATINRSETRQDSMGFGLQASRSVATARGENVLVAGVSVDDGRIRFASSTELGALDESRLAVPGGVFVGEAFTSLRADVTTTGVYVADTWAPAEHLSLTLAARYNRTRVKLRDGLGTALNGDHAFGRLNPAFGVTWQVRETFGLYAGINESSRVPSPVELTCADEDDPCRLPNAFLADPPLEQVVARTVEAGARGRWAEGQWHAGVFHTRNSDDILFISAGALTNEGFFDNVGQTLRRGVELDASGQMTTRIAWFANVTLLDATFREHLSLPSPNNPAAVDGEVVVQPGDRLPLVPRNLLKAGVRVAVGTRASLGADVAAAGGFHARGDEGNDVESIGRFATLNLRADYEVNSQLLLFANVDNALDAEYETFGVFGEPDDVLGEGFENPRFVSPGAPRALWVGVRVSL
jgi:outer membrane receptor protein involved in Fe transport